MADQKIVFTGAFSAWEIWRLTEFNARKEGLLSVKDALDKHDSQYAQVMGFHIEQATALIGVTHSLNGPTGESNELYTTGRGVTVIIVESSSEEASIVLLAQLTAALIAGNSVVICGHDLRLQAVIEAAYSSSSLPQNLIQFLSLDAASQMLESDVKVVGFIGSLSGEIKLNRHLAKRQGAIVTLVAETEIQPFSMAHDPYLSLRFMTERTRTINITAVGGNATLLGANHL
ncbi:1-pyrroline-5-carboxylate dehydrogenase [Vibrio renipiscarius]|uniref:1-pyrroline-5-carboxylate dehydrogenase n=1 Tax=Vibrio renipiscarius TaxID=1461322 RepID=A0A0C2K863_9VIBR|nr:1-pyrroline-5-carboxylate dehydrogenase [Vibrio renipiscarius]KII76275.1 1-pyrroline-5-carboxylate dehydrogenase [Vibrio renipiscarius]KII78203.1 1-pyrroline-5-carboxylate dehydrogenase [Vibrio renipiscarius]